MRGKHVVVLFALFVAVACFWLATATTQGSPSAAAKLTFDLSIGDTPGRPHVCQPSQMARVLRRRHPLYRRPHQARTGATQLMLAGWSSWILDPPSEAT